MLEVLARAIRREKIKKRHPNQKGKSKISSVYKYITPYAENAKDSILKKTIRINEFIKVEENKNQRTKISCASLYQQPIQKEN